MLYLLIGERILCFLNPFVLFSVSEACKAFVLLSINDKVSLNPIFHRTKLAAFVFSNNEEKSQREKKSAKNRFSESQFSR